jgi:hypothetical protein
MPVAMSHDDGNFVVPVMLNWKWHCAGSATTVTGALVCAASSAGLP